MTKGKVSIDVDLHTDKLQLKLRAIAKHTAALADELDEIDKPLLIVVSKVTEEHILKQYPHLTKKQVQLLFNEGYIKEVHEDQYIDGLTIHDCQRKLCIDRALAEWLGINECIDLITDEDGIIYTKRL